jgi:hypothetical protein
LRDKGIVADHAPIIAGLLLAADDASYAFTNWLRGGAQEVRFGEHTLPPLASEDDRRRALVSIAALAAATGSPLLLVFDQIEAASRVADHAHLGKLIASAVQLVEHNVVGTAVVISALQDTYKIVKAAHLDASFVDRIENGVSPVTLRPPTPGELREIIRKRTAYLLQLSEAAAEAETSWQMVPDWLLATTDSTMLRRALQDVRDYRNACRDAGRFLDQHEYRGKDAGRQGGSEAQQPELPAEEFEKLWQDAIDANLGTAVNIPTSEKIALFQWLVENIAPELPQVSALTVESRTLEGSNPTRIFDLQFRDGDDVAFERWKIAVADAPNSQGQLRDQIVAFLDNADNALPGLLRLGAPLPRVRNDGEPTKSTTDVRGTQAGPPLADLLEAGGRIAPTDQRDWIRLRLAWQFVEQRRAAKGFTEWRVQRRFLLNMAGIGVMTKLLLPKTSNVTPFPGPAGGRDNRTGETPRSSSEAAGQAQSAVHPADRADVLLGRTQAGKPVRWCLNKDADPALPNFGLMVSGDAGQGKTQIIKAIIAEVADLDCPVLVFDFKNDYGGPFAQAQGFESIDLNDGLPFNPLQLPPHGANGSQAINHLDTEAAIVSDRGLEESDGAGLVFVGEDLAEGQPRMVVDGASERLPLTMNVRLCANSHPGPAPERERWLDWPVRSPVMRWPMALKRPSFLMSMWMISPGVARS